MALEILPLLGALLYSLDRASYRGIVWKVGDQGETLCMCWGIGDAWLPRSESPGLDEVYLVNWLTSTQRHLEQHKTSELHLEQAMLIRPSTCWFAPKIGNPLLPPPPSVPPRPPWPHAAMMTHNPSQIVKSNCHLNREVLDCVIFCLS